MIIIPGLILLTGMVLLLEFKVRWHWIRVLAVLLLVLGAAGVSANIGISIGSASKDMRNERLLYHLMDGLCATSEAGDHAMLDAKLKRLRAELPEAIQDGGHLALLVDQMQFVTVETNRMER